MPYCKKLIEVSLPLEAINAESAREKSIRHGHPSTLHLWWARRPLAACRAVLFSSLVDDPSEYMLDEASADAERERLFGLIEELVKWENINNEEVLDKARLEIAHSVARDLGVDVPVGKAAIRKFLEEKAPPVLDPFAGGGSIPLEAQRLGLRAYASDLNPVAVLINKALIEIPPRFAGMPPVHPVEERAATGDQRSGKKSKAADLQARLWKKEWKGAEGLAEDVRYYGRWMRDEAEKCIGHLYPKYKITAELLAERPDLKAQGLKPGDELTVIAWLWARTVNCSNPACSAKIPLARTFTLTKRKAVTLWAEPLIDITSFPSKIDFKIRTGKDVPPEGTVNRNGAYCIACKTPIPLEYVRSEGRAKRLGKKLMAIVCDGREGRIYLNPTSRHESIAAQVIPPTPPDTYLPEKALGFRVQAYGMTKHADLFTPRQLFALTTFTRLLEDVKGEIIRDSIQIGRGYFKSYAEAVITYLAFIVDKLADLANSLNSWEPVAQCPRHLFARQAIPFVWDYAEGNPIGYSSGSWEVLLENTLRTLSSPSFNFERTIPGTVTQKNASEEIDYIKTPLISTDPPYYDNVPYADLSDFFYFWLRQSLIKVYPDLFHTMLVPKGQELIADPFRHYGVEEARRFFENGMGNVFLKMNQSANSHYPITVYYAFKQGEEESNEREGSVTYSSAIVSTGWETMLEGLLASKFSITGTWPIRTENASRMRGQNSNALASSIVLVCRPRPKEAPTATRREFLYALKRELPPALHQLQQGNIAPVDLAQAAIGPGMAIFSRYKQVLEADGSTMRVRAALALINQALDEYLTEQEGEYDADTRWALAWFEQYGHEAGPYGAAETLSKAKNTSVDGLAHAGFLESRAGKVRLLRRDELDTDWDPARDKRLTAWEAAQHLIRALDRDGEAGAGALLSKLGAAGETARDLAYRLYTVCERKGWAQEALSYNMLVVAWPRLKEGAGKGTRQEKLF